LPPVDKRIESGDVLQLLDPYPTRARANEKPVREECPMTIYPFRGPLVRPSTESDKLAERDREEDDKGGDGGGGEESNEEPGDSFASGSDFSKKLEKALGGKKSAPATARAGGTSVLAIRLKR
jgi:hypothetical protein